MTVTGCSIGTQNMTVPEAKQRLAPEKAAAATKKVTSVVGQLGALSALCNAAELDASAGPDVPASQKKVFGDATDTAILRFSEELETGNVSYFRACWQKVFELTFNSKNKFMIRCFTNSRPEAVEQTMPWEAAQAFKPTDVYVSHLSTLRLLEKFITNRSIAC